MALSGEFMVLIEVGYKDVGTSLSLLPKKWIEYSGPAREEL